MASLQSASEHSILLPSLSGSALKVIALVSMVTDHCAYYLMEHGTLLYEVMRCFGLPHSRGLPAYPKPDEVLPAAARVCCSQ